MIINKNLKSNLARKTLALAVAAGLAGASFTVQAANTGTLSVTASVTESCDFVTSAPVAFGAVTPLVDTDAAGSISYNCTKGSAYKMSLDGGNNYLGGRYMDNGSTGRLGYQLYSDFNRTTVWYDTAVVLLDTTLGYVAGGSSVPVYGRVLSTGFDNAEPGSYSDVVNVAIVL
jgi:spore coat protein U-like protein